MTPRFGRLDDDMTGAAGRAKGSVLVYAREYVEKRHGAQAWTNVVDMLPDADRDVLRGVLISGGWYPVGTWNRLLEGYLPEHHATPDVGMAELSQYIANADLNSVYKLVIKLGSPEFLLRRTQSLWNRYFDSGLMSPVEVAARRWAISLDAPRGIDEAPHRYTCAAGVGAWITAGLKLTGVDAEIEHVKCRLGSGRMCEYLVTW